MNAHELMTKTNHYIIKGGGLTDTQKANIVRQLLDAQSGEREKQSFYKGVKYENNTDKDGDVTGTYPAYYITPYNNGKKLQTIIPMSPKTHILSSNAYELDIIRLLCLFAPDNPVVKEMVRGVIKRLKTACFVNDCIIGECFHTSLPALRFINAAAPGDTEWMKKLVEKINNNIDAKYKENAVNYFMLCLSELPYNIAEPGLLKYKSEFYERLKKSASVKTEYAKTYQPVLYYIYRNCLGSFPEYGYIRNRQPYISDKDGRLYFDIDIEK
ncbi:MAG: hypothetical protein FWH10_06545 [Oscillospiraceae bacterium]|nr:hypothetical protein [Oscillospiraceae bacterium]